MGDYFNLELGKNRGLLHLFIFYDFRLRTKQYIWQISYELHQAEDDVTAGGTNSVLRKHRSKRHQADLELFNQFKQKLDTPSWLPELKGFYY